MRTAILRLSLLTYHFIMDVDDVNKLHKIIPDVKKQYRWCPYIAVPTVCVGVLMGNPASHNVGWLHIV